MYKLVMNSFAVVALTFSTLAAEAGPLESIPARESDASRASKNGKLAGDIAGAKYVVTYGRPKVKGRNVWKEHVKPGDVWRVGADEATAIAFDKDVTVEGQKLAAGAYAFYAVPGADPTKDAWTIVFSKEPKQWGAYKYDVKQDALRVKATPKAAPMTEELTFRQEGNALVLQWEKVAVPVQIQKAN